MSKRKKKVKTVKRQALGVKKEKQGFLLKARSAEVIPRYQVYAVAVVIMGFVIGTVRFGFAPLPQAYSNFLTAIDYAEVGSLAAVIAKAAPDSYFMALIGALAYKFTGANPMILTNIIGYAAFLYILFALGKRAYREEEDIPDIPQRFSGFWLVAFYPAMWIYVSSGTEVVLFTAFATAGFLLLVDCLEYDTPSWQSGLALGLAAMVRPEAALFAACAFILILVFGRQGSKIKDAVTNVVIALAIFASFTALRVSTGGSLFDGAFDALGQYGAGSTLGPGVGYMLIWAMTNIIASATVVIAVYHVFTDSPIRTRSMIGIVWLLCFDVLVIAMGGDGAPYGRLYLAAIPVVAWMMADQWPLIAKSLEDRGIAKIGVTRYAGFGIILASLAWPAFYPPHYKEYNNWLEQSADDRKIGGELKKLTAGVKTTIGNPPSPVMRFHSGFATADDPALYWVGSFEKDIEPQALFYETMGITSGLRESHDISERYTLMKMKHRENPVVFLVKKETVKSFAEAFESLDLFQTKSKHDDAS